jgi:hypothetical protein
VRSKAAPRLQRLGPLIGPFDEGFGGHDTDGAEVRATIGF